MNIIRAFFLVLRNLFRCRGDLILENLALRQQLLVQQRTLKRPKLQNGDRRFRAWLSRVWPDWKSAIRSGRCPERTGPGALPESSLN